MAPAITPLGGREPLLVVVLVSPAVILPGRRPRMVGEVEAACRATSGLISGCRRLSRLSSPTVPRRSTTIWNEMWSATTIKIFLNIAGKI